MWRASVLTYRHEYFSWTASGCVLCYVHMCVCVCVLCLSFTLLFISTSVGQNDKYYSRKLQAIVSDVRTYEGCPESIQPLWISREPVAWPWCNLAASQRRPYCASVNSHCPLGLVSRKWDAVDWDCVLCDLRIKTFLPFNGDCRFGNSQKSQRAKFGMYGGWKTWVMWCFAKKACTRAVEWTGVLSWWGWSARSVIVNATVTQYTSSVNSVSLPTD